MPNHRIDPQTLRVFLKRTSLTALTALKRLSMSSNSGVPYDITDITMYSPTRRFAMFHARSPLPLGPLAALRSAGLAAGEVPSSRGFSSKGLAPWWPNLQKIINIVFVHVCVYTFKNQVYNYIILYLVIIYIYIYNVYIICMTYDSATNLTFIRLQLTYNATNLTFIRLQLTYKMEGHWYEIGAVYVGIYMYVYACMHVCIRVNSNHQWHDVEWYWMIWNDMGWNKYIYIYIPNIYIYLIYIYIYLIYIYIFIYYTHINDDVDDSTIMRGRRMEMMGVRTTLLL